LCIRKRRMRESRYSASSLKPQLYTEASIQVRVAAASSPGKQSSVCSFWGLCRTYSRPGGFGGSEISCACCESNHDSSVMQPAALSLCHVRYSCPCHSYRRCGKSVIEKNVTHFISIYFTKIFLCVSCSQHTCNYVEI